MPALLPLQTEHLFTMDLRVGAPQTAGRGPDGHELRIVPVTGGSVTGPRLNGEILPGASADWLRVEADGTAHIDVRLSVRTDTGAIVHVRYSGIRTGAPEVLSRLNAGEPVPPEDYYFRIALRFETGDPALAWLNRVVAVGTGQRPPSGPRYDVYGLL